MKQKRHNNIQESEVEDALVANLTYLNRLLGFDFDLKLISRQLKLKDGEQRIDLLLLHSKDIILIELKVTRFYEEHLKQISDYIDELEKLQANGQLISGNIKGYILVTEFKKSELEFFRNTNVQLVKYEPVEVLKEYFDNLSEVAPFLKIRPNDYGVYSFGLINRAIKKLGEGINDKEKIIEQTQLSKFSIHNHLRVAKEFGLVRERSKKYFLTDLGDKFLAQMQDGKLADEISKQQAEIIKQFVAKDPFYSSTVFGIYSVVESAFLLSRNIYPIEFADLIQMFKTVSGKKFEWQAQRAQQTATYTFLGFATELGLLGKIGKQIVITPAGFRFILMLQLHKSIEMIESLNSKNNN